MPDILEIADRADMIIDGYAFLKGEHAVRVLNLNDPNKALVLLNDGSVLETTMDDIELNIVTEHFERNRKYLEA